MKTEKLGLISMRVMSKEALHKNKDILERTAIALGRKKVFKTIYSSNSDCEINPHAIYSATE